MTESILTSEDRAKLIDRIAEDSTVLNCRSAPPLAGGRWPCSLATSRAPLLPSFPIPRSRSRSLSSCLLTAGGVAAMSWTG